VSRFATKEELLEDAITARLKLDTLLATIPDRAKYDEVTDGMSTKDFIAHRAEWGRMALAWHVEARAGGNPAVPSDDYTWGQLKELNADIHTRHADMPLDDAQRAFDSVNDQLIEAIDACSDDELFAKHYYDFTASSDLATYFTSATGGHYRSAYKYINRWWRANKDTYAITES